MPLSEFEVEKLKQEMDGLIEAIRPPSHLREQLDFEYRTEGQSIMLIERRPHWRRSGEYTEAEFAKVTWNRSKTMWRVYWMRASGKWELYEPQAEVASLKEWMALIREDAHGCFLG